MYTLKGFFAYPSLVDNNQDTVALFGELSSDGMSYAKDKQLFVDEGAPGTQLIAFHSVKDGNHELPPLTLPERILQLGQYILERAAAGQIGTNPSQLVQSIMAEFTGLISGLTIGEILYDGNLRMPEWIRYKDEQLGEDNEITVWLSDDSFRRQYPEYSIEIVVPMTPLDNFFQDPMQVRDLLSQYSIVNTMNQVQAIRGEYPYTYAQAHQFNYRNPLDHDFQVPTYWVVVIYGQAGNNPDLIKNALIDHILANSTHSREEWADILPDLFITTEFIITPFWTQYAIPNMQLQAGIYSPIVKPSEAIELLKATAKGGMYSAQWVEETAELSLALYKSLPFGVVGNPDNRGGLDRFTKIFPDYIVVSNDSADFNRMNPYTQEWVVLFSQLIRIAETFTATSSVPLGFSRITRDGVLYVAAVYDNITFLVAAKSAIEDITSE